MPALPFRSQLFALAALVLFVGLLGAVVPRVGAQEADDLAGAPVDVHSGTCEDPVLEPGADGGELGADTLDGISDDEYSQVGILTDEAAGARGVDLNRDGALQDNEMIGGADQDVPVAWADADFDEAVDTEQPWVVIVHADADAGYSTFIACGSLTDAQPDDEGRRIIPLEAQGDYTAFGYAVLEESGQTLHTYMFQGGSVPQATPNPQAGADEGPFPIDIHSGTCADWTTEPAYDLGDMELTNVAADDEQEPGDVEAELPPEAADLGPVYKEQGELDFDGQQLLDEGPYVVGVHQSAEEYETLVACGVILPILDGDSLLVPLQPVGESTFTGVVRFTTEGSDFTGFLWTCEPLPANEEAAPTPAPTEAPTEAPTATPTEEPTATPEPSVVIEETEIITETEVVSAEEATARATEEAGG